MDWSCSLMQAGRPNQDRQFPFGQFHHAIAGSIRVNSIVRSGSIPVNFIGRTGRAPLRVGEKQCDRLFPSSQFNRAIAA
ncbi:hypothetical protein [Coleofasciculus chthonoplastes]|uniref:hypothetical protein n=1 Tax=Coleofasciculus chthonoplastes TaxID=64178 RepID=UPI0033037967